MLKAGITDRQKVEHVSPNRILSEEEDKNLTDFIYIIVPQPITTRQRTKEAGI
jgi:hypothetical protein